MKFYNPSLSMLKDFISEFSKLKINNIAAKTKFTKRQSKLDGYTFLKAFVFGVPTFNEVSLRKIAEFCEDICDGLRISRQAIENKLKPGAGFLKEIFEITLTNKLIRLPYHNHIDIFKSFTDIVVADSTVFELHESLKDKFKGYGGSNSKAGIKIQTVYSLKNKQLKTIEFQDEVYSDKPYTQSIVDTMGSNELLLVDLGYFNKSSFADLQNKKSYFLSKIMSNTALYTYSENIKKGKKFKRLDLVDFLKKSNGIIDTELYVGMQQNNRIKCRVIGIKLSDVDTNKRIMKAKEKARSQGKTLKKIDRELMSWIIMITNIEANKATAEILIDIYRVRWQIEILFKCWKTHIKIDSVENIGEDYLYCLLYGRLILSILVNSMHSVLYYHYKTKHNIEVSILMIYSSIEIELKAICKNLVNKHKNIMKIYNILKRLGEKCKREKRNRKTTEELLYSYCLPPAV
jgi:hypothetical protein